MEPTISTNPTLVTYDQLRKLGIELARNSSPLFEVWYVPPKPPANERQLVSRNKREGWYRGRVRDIDEWFGTRWEDFRWPPQPLRHCRTRIEAQRLGWTFFLPLQNYRIQIENDGEIGSISTFRMVVSAPRGSR